MFLHFEDKLIMAGEEKTRLLKSVAIPLGDAQIHEPLVGFPWGLYRLRRGCIRVGFINEANIYLVLKGFI